MFYDPPWGTSWNTCQDKVYIPPAKTACISDAPRVIKKVCPEARLEELRLARVAAHPDKGGSHEEFIRINAEYEALRRLYARP
jgi:hypothetical protein